MAYNNLQQPPIPTKSQPTSTHTDPQRPKKIIHMNQKWSRVHQKKFTTAHNDPQQFTKSRNAPKKNHKNNI